MDHPLYQLAARSCPEWWLTWLNSGDDVKGLRLASKELRDFADPLVRELNVSQLPLQTAVDAASLLRRCACMA